MPHSWQLTTCCLGGIDRLTRPKTLGTETCRTTKLFETNYQEPSWHRNCRRARQRARIRLHQGIPTGEEHLEKQAVRRLQAHHGSEAPIMPTWSEIADYVQWSLGNKSGGGKGKGPKGKNGKGPKGMTGKSNHLEGNGPDECQACGSWHHTKQGCPHKKAVCNSCGQVGHLARKCPKPKQEEDRVPRYSV